MDRQIVYPAELPRSFDFLEQENNTLYALGYSLQAAVGVGTFVDGLACTSGAGVSVNIGSGSIIQQETVDQNGVALGGLPVDNNTIMKIGLLTSPTNIVLTVPGTSGYSINYLVEAQLQEVDGQATVLPYYNASNPAVPFNGPSNSGTSQNTRRSEIVALQLKAGTAATTGSQNTPGADSGWVPLWVITVTNGQTSVSTSNIYRAPQAPFLGTKVGQLRYKLSSNLTLYVSTTGNDSTNNGLSTNVAFATPQAAWNALINNYDLNGYSATISIATGTYSSAGNSFAGQPTGFGASNAVYITGAGSSTILASTGALGSAIGVSNGSAVVVTNLTVTASGAGGNGLQAYGSGSQITDGGGVVYGACVGSHRLANGGQILITGNSSISGAAANHFGIINGGQIVSFGTPVTSGAGALAFTAFASVATGNLNLSSGMTFSGTGSFTGQRYSALLGGAINTGGAGTSYFPGSSAGTTGSGTNTGFYA